MGYIHVFYVFYSIFSLLLIQICPLFYQILYSCLIKILDAQVQLNYALDATYHLQEMQYGSDTTIKRGIPFFLVF